MSKVRCRGFPVCTIGTADVPPEDWSEEEFTYCLHSVEHGKDDECGDPCHWMEQLPADELVFITSNQTCR